MPEVMMPAAGGGGAPAGNAGGGQLLQPTPSNFASNMAAKNSAQPNAPQQQTLQPGVGQNWNQFRKPEFDASQGVGADQRHLNPGDEGQPSPEEQNGLGPRPEEQQGLEQQPQDGQLTPEQMLSFASSLLQQLQGGQFPEQLMDAMIKVPWGPNGESREVPVRELQRSFMRQSDYTRAKTEIRQQAQELQSTRENLQRIFQSFDQPEQMFQQLIGMGKRKTVEALAKMVFKQWRDDEMIVRALPNEQQRAAMRLKIQRTYELEDKQLMQDRQLAEAQNSSRQNQNTEAMQENARQIQNQMNQLWPLAARAYGINMKVPYNKVVFEQQLVAVAQNMGGVPATGISREMAMLAAQGAKEILEDDLNRARQAQDGQNGGNVLPSQPLNPLRLPSGAPSPQQQALRQNGQRRRPGQFSQDMRTKNGGALGW